MQSSSGSGGSSASLDRRAQELESSAHSIFDGLDATDEFELGYLACPRNDQVGVGGSDCAESREWTEAVGCEDCTSDRSRSAFFDLLRVI